MFCVNYAVFFKSLFLCRDNERRYGGEQGGYRNPDADRLHAVLVEVRFAGAHLVGLHVDHVVLLQIVGGRLEHFRRLEIQTVDGALSSFLADYVDLVAQTLDGKVASHRDGFEHVDFVAFNAV